MGIFDSNIHMNGAGTTYQSFLEPSRKAAVEIEASALGPAQKKAFLAKVMAAKIDLAHVKMAIRTVSAFDGGALSGAVKAGDGAKLANEFFRFVASINSSASSCIMQLRQAAA